MGFLKKFFGGETDPEEEKKQADERNFDLLKYDGVKAMRMGQFEYAVKCFREALKTKDDLEVRDHLWNALMRLGLFDEALTELDEIITLQPDNIEAVLQAANAAFMKEDYKTMEAYCEQALNIDAEQPIAYLLYAKAAIGQDDLLQAIVRLTKSISLEERLIEPRLLRAQTLMRMGDLKEAEADVNWLASHTEDNEDVILLHARLEAAKGNADAAIDLYGKVIDVNPFSVEAYRERGSLHLAKGDKAGAEEDMKKVLELNPEEMADVNGEYSAEGIERKTRQAYSMMNPFGI